MNCPLNDILYYSNQVIYKEFVVNIRNPDLFIFPFSEKKRKEVNRPTIPRKPYYW